MPRAIPVLLLLLLLAWTAAPLRAQTAHGVGSDAEVGASVSLRTGMTWMGRRAIPVGSLAGTIRLSPQLEVGGEGLVSLRAVRISPEDSPDRSELRTGYGGVLVRWKPAGSVPGPRWGGSLLLGAGMARIRSPLVDAEVASESFLFLEPAVHLLLRQDRMVRLSADGGYRITLGAEALPGVERGEFRAPALTLTVQLVRDP